VVDQNWQIGYNIHMFSKQGSEMKKWRVSLDIPGAGYELIVEADTKEEAIEIAFAQTRQRPDGVYETNDKNILSQALVELDRHHQDDMQKLIDKHQHEVYKLMLRQAKERARLVLA
jgi:hypothetical protein